MRKCISLSIRMMRYLKKNDFFSKSELRLMRGVMHFHVLEKKIREVAPFFGDLIVQAA